MINAKEYPGLEQFPNLFSPYTMNGKTIRNRIVAAPMGGPGGVPHADSCVGWVLQPEICVDPVTGGQIGGSPGEYTDDELFLSPGELFERIDTTLIRSSVDAYHRGGMIICRQINHPGARRFEYRFAKDQIGAFAIGPSSQVRSDGVVVLEMDRVLMNRVIEGFVSAALFCKRAGYDGVFVHSAHGWLMHQFLSPITNLRTDEYGGSIENRMRFPLEIIRAIREAVGDDFIIDVRVSGSERTPLGYTREDMICYAKAMDGIASGIHVSTGRSSNTWIHGLYSSAYHAHFLNLEDAAAIKAQTKNLAVTVVGGINSPEECERVIAQGKVDFVAVARQLMADPHFARKALLGRAWDINRCVRCNYCKGYSSYQRSFGLLEMRVDDLDGLPQQPICPVNPMRWGECADAVPPQGAENPKRVLVIGGGPGGLQAAVTAAEQGHSVTLAEASGRLGGMFNFCESDPQKADMYHHLQLMIRRAEEHENITVELNTRVDGDYIQENRPEYIICAVGARQLGARLPGTGKVAPFMSAYGNDKIGQRVVIIGGDQLGCDLAVYLRGRDREVTVLDRKAELCQDVPDALRIIVEGEFAEKGIAYRCNIEAFAVTEEGVFASVLGEGMEGSQRLYRADTVFATAGRSANDSVREALRAAAGDIPFTAVGDCVRARKFPDAVHEGAAAAYHISHPDYKLDDRDSPGPGKWGSRWDREPSQPQGVPRGQLFLVTITGVDTPLLSYEEETASQLAI